MTTIRVLQAADRIGGNCIEITANNGQRILLDAGKPLELPSGAPVVPPPDIDMSQPCLGVLISHSHQDHHGLLETLPADWPVYCGQATWELLGIDAAVRRTKVSQQPIFWKSGKKLCVGPFVITPQLVDHSAFDAYFLIIEVDGRRIAYTGDFRDTGRKGESTRRLIENPPQNIDALIMEGTNLYGAGKAKKESQSEAGLEAEFAEIFSQTTGRVFVSWAGTNIDRTVTLFRACKKSGRVLVLDLYTMAVLRTLAKFALIPQPEWIAPITTVETERMRDLVTRLGYADFVKELQQLGKIVSAKKLCENRGKWVIQIRSSMIDDYKKDGLAPDESDVWLWSLWKGYLQDGKQDKLMDYFNGRQPIVVHASGHASPETLVTLANNMNPRMLIPVHGDSWPENTGFFPNIRIVANGEYVALGRTLNNQPSFCIEGAKMPDKTLEQIAGDFTTELNAKRGRPAGYPGDFEYAVTASANGVEVSLKDAGKEGSETSVWRRPDPWGLTIAREFEEFLRDNGLPCPKITLKIVVRETTPSTQPSFEALLRRISYLDHINEDMNFVLFVGENKKTLYTEEELANRELKNEVVRDGDYDQRDDKDSPGRLEKDFQTYLFGKGLYDSTALADSDGIRSNVRLALLGPDFAEGDKNKSGALEREFPTGAFLSQKSSATRVLPTWFVDLLTINRYGKIAAIELKFHNNKNVPTLEVLSQILDYALFFHCYRQQLQPIFEKRIKCTDKSTPVVTYFVSNMYHSRFKTICKRYTKGKLEIKFIQMGYMWK